MDIILPETEEEKSKVAEMAFETAGKGDEVVTKSNDAIPLQVTQDRIGQAEPRFLRVFIPHRASCENVFPDRGGEGSEFSVVRVKTQLEVTCEYTFILDDK